MHLGGKQVWNLAELKNLLHACGAWKSQIKKKSKSGQLSATAVDFFSLPFLTQRGFKIWLTFSLDLKDTDGVLRRQVPELAGRQCVSPLSQGADGRLQEEGLEERRTGDLMCHDGSVLQEVLEYFSGLFLDLR